MTSRRPIVITGFMGCGKSEAARHLARRLNVEMVDLDDAITNSTGRTPALLIREEGERVFRTIETTALAELLEKKTADVIALGGGAWIEKANRDLIEQSGALSVWLDTPFDLCWKRIEVSSEDRPLGQTKQQADELYKRRLPIYKLANVRVETMRADDPDTLAALIAREVARLTNS